MKSHPLSAGEVRFRTDKKDRERIAWLLENHPDEHRTISALLRSLIYKEYLAYTDTPLHGRVLPKT